MDEGNNLTFKYEDNRFKGRNIQIRKANKDDIDQIMILVRKMRDDFPGLETEELLQDHKVTTLRIINDGRSFVAIDDNKVVGNILFSVKRNAIDFLCVDIDYQRRGVGSCLLTNTLNILDNKKDVVLSTYVKEDKRSLKAWSFYKKFGFKEGELEFDGPEPSIQFVLKNEK